MFKILLSIVLFTMTLFNTDDNEAIQSIPSHTKEHGCNRETPSKKDSIQEKI